MWPRCPCISSPSSPPTPPSLAGHRQHRVAPVDPAGEHVVEVTEETEEYPCFTLDRASEADVRRFVQETQGLTDADDRRNAAAVYEVSMRANSALYGRLRRDPEMCTAFRELFKDEILEAEQRDAACDLEADAGELHQLLKRRLFRRAAESAEIQCSAVDRFGRRVHIAAAIAEATGFQIRLAERGADLLRGGLNAG